MVRIAFLFSGLVRKNFLTTDENSDERILDSFRKHLFNEELSNICDYDVFISTDKLNVSKAQEFFGGHLKNVHFYETGYYLNEVHLETPSFERATKRPFNFEGKHIANGNLYQAYRMLDVHNLLTDYINKTDTNYDLVVRLRLDGYFPQPFLRHFKDIIENPEIHMIAFQDQFMIGRPGIMKALMRGLETKYCLYKSPLGNRGDWEYCIMSNEQYFNYFEDVYCKWAPEMQYTCLILDYCYRNNINLLKALKGYAVEAYVII
jgi:hypothetical protein